MKLTCTKALILNTKNGPKTFSPGETFEADLDKARPYIEKGFLRLGEDPLADLKSGDTIEWAARIFGKLTGPVKEILGDGVLVVGHPLNDGRYGPATIRREGVTRIIEETTIKEKGKS